MTAGAPEAILMRLPAEADRLRGRARTAYIHVPVLIDVGTSSYADTSKIIAALRRDFITAPPGEEEGQRPADAPQRVFKAALRRRQAPA